jgi:hypothetical protein
METPKLIIGEKVISTEFYINQKVYFKSAKDGELWWGHVSGIRIGIDDKSEINILITVKPFDGKNTYCHVQSDQKEVVFFKDLESFSEYYKREIDRRVEREKNREVE